MPIENRNLSVGARLVASYKKQAYVCRVEQEGEGIAFVLEDGRRFKSTSAAGSAVMGGKAVNGWRFWSLESEAASGQRDAPAQGENDGRRKGRRGTKMFYRLPNQQGVAAGMVRYWCNGCQKSFIAEAGPEPEACPDGHLNPSPEPTSPVAGEEPGA